MVFGDKLFCFVKTYDDTTQYEVGKGYVVNRISRDPWFRERLSIQRGMRIFNNFAEAFGSNEGIRESPYIKGPPRYFHVKVEPKIELASDECYTDRLLVYEELKYEDILETITEDMYIKAVQYTCFKFNSIPSNTLTYTICLKALKKKWGACYFSDIPQHFVDSEMCSLAIERDPHNLNHIPEKYRTPQLIMSAVASNGHVLKYIKEEDRSLGLCVAAVRCYGMALKYVPILMKTPEICLLAIFEDVKALEYAIKPHISSQ